MLRSLIGAAGATLVAAAAQAQQPQSYYWCQPTGPYYPQVTACPGGWKEVPQYSATPAAPTPQTPAPTPPLATKPQSNVALDLRDWKKIEADNGQVYFVDINHVDTTGVGTKWINVYTYEGAQFLPGNLRTFIFDCEGHFQIGGTSGVSYAPPRSIAGIIGALACAGRSPSPKG